MHRLAAQQAQAAQQVALLGVVPDQVEAAVPDRRFAVRAGYQVRDQAVRPGVHLTGRLTQAGQRHTVRHGLLGHHGAPQQHPRVVGIRVVRVHAGAHRAPRPIRPHHQVGGVLAASRGAHLGRFRRAAGPHVRDLGAAQQRDPRAVQGLLFQPVLQQVPGGGVAVGTVHDRGIRIDAGHLPEQGDVYAQPATARHGRGRAALQHGHADAEPVQRDGGGQPDQAATRDHTAQGAAGRVSHNPPSGVSSSAHPGPVRPGRHQSPE